MKKLNLTTISLAIVILVMSPSIVKAEGLLDEPDRQVHAGISALISLVSYVTLRVNRHDRWSSMITAFTLTMALGIAKEVADSPMDSDDIKANAAGAAAGTILTLSMDW